MFSSRQHVFSDPREKNENMRRWYARQVRGTRRAGSRRLQHSSLARAPTRSPSNHISSAAAAFGDVSVGFLEPGLGAGVHLEHKRLRRRIADAVGVLQGRVRLRCRMLVGRRQRGQCRDLLPIAEAPAPGRQGRRQRADTAGYPASAEPQRGNTSHVAE
jgi:hypothetical protein